MPPRPPAFGGSHRAYYAWRWPLLRRPLRRILVESDVTDLEIATYPAPATLGSGSSGGVMHGNGNIRGSGAGGDRGPESMEGVETTAEQQHAEQQRGAVGVGWEHNVVQRAAFGALENWVVSTEATNGLRICSVALERSYPPFYFYWQACGTRLLFLRWAG